MEQQLQQLGSCGSQAAEASCSCGQGPGRPACWPNCAASPPLPPNTPACCPAGKDVLWIEWGVGGGASQNGDTPAATALEAAYYPFWGERSL